MHIKESLKDVQNQVQNYLMSLEASFGACQNMKFLFAPLSGDTAKQVSRSICNIHVQDAMLRGLTEYLSEPIKAALDFCDSIDALVSRRKALLLDYDHHKRKNEALAARLEGSSEKKKTEIEEELGHRQAKLHVSTEKLRECTTELEGQMAALSKVEPMLKESLFKGLAACQTFQCQASLAAFDPEFLDSPDILDYMERLEHISTLLHNQMPLPPPGDHVMFLQNALAAAAQEAKAVVVGEVYGRHLSDFEEVPPVILECMGFLDAHGLYVPGLFRVPGNSETVADLKRRFNQGQHIEFNEAIHNVHDVAALLKMFYRDLPEPVIPASEYFALMSAGSIQGDGFILAAQASIGRFPAMNAACTRLLFAFLYRVNLCSSDNKMTAENLGIIFAPNLMRAPNSSELSVMDLQVNRKDRENRAELDYRPLFPIRPGTALHQYLTPSSLLLLAIESPPLSLIPVPYILLLFSSIYMFSP
ncbi:unnamed protein product [Chrysoparadoxa australica]